MEVNSSFLPDRTILNDGHLGDGTEVRRYDSRGRGGGGERVNREGNRQTTPLVGNRLETTHKPHVKKGTWEIRQEY